MSGNHKHIAFLCGHFTRDKAVDESALQGLGWNLVKYSDSERQQEKRFYYPDFVDFCYNNSMDEGCVRYSLQVGQTVNMTAKLDWEDQERTLPPFIVKEITLYFMPQRMVLYSICVEQEVPSFDDCSSAMFFLRHIDAFAKEHYSPFRTVAIDPIVEVYDLLKEKRLQEFIRVDRDGNKHQDYGPLVENGNKLRLFQIVHAAKGTIANDEERRRQIYRLATFMPVATNNMNDTSDGLFAEHQRQEFEKNSITVFPGWTAFALLDTFTILSTDTEDQNDSKTKTMNKNWGERYFGMIYIHALFQKNCLFDFNNRFKQALNDISKRRSQGFFRRAWLSVKELFKKSSPSVADLVAEYEDFERNSCFNRISYNFLPLLVSEAIDNSLQINDEMKQLFNTMAKERTRDEELGRKKMNSLLIAISVLTLFSAIWDATSMFEKMFSFNSFFGSEFWGYRIVGLIMAFFVVGLLVYFYHRKREK